MKVNELDIKDLAADARALVAKYSSFTKDDYENLEKDVQGLISLHSEAVPQAGKIFKCIKQYILRKYNEQMFIELLQKQYRELDEKFFADLEDGTAWQMDVPADVYAEAYDLGKYTHFDAKGMVPYIINLIKEAMAGGDN